MSNCHCQENIEGSIEEAGNFDCKKKHGDGLIVTIVTAVV